ncbi:MAG: OadG family protein [Bacteroidaceae bacterium]|nr:OadG family protein [Bacteroidaceae bacterium]
MENLETALMLMVVGMTTVFVILLLVIGLGKVLIAFVNKYIPEEVVHVKNKTVQSSPPAPANVMAAITAAVNVVTHGKGKVEKIEKV